MSLATPQLLQGRDYYGTEIYVWTLTADGDDTAVVVPHHSGLSFDVYGTFGSGTVTIQGANHPTVPDWKTLTDPFNAALTFTTAAIKQVLQDVYQIRPSLSGATGPSLTVVMKKSRNG